jgi:hypothetical protein
MRAMHYTLICDWISMAREEANQRTTVLPHRVVEHDACLVCAPPDDFAAQYFGSHLQAHQQPASILESLQIKGNQGCSLYTRLRDSWLLLLCHTAQLALTSSSREHGFRTASWASSKKMSCSFATISCKCQITYGYGWITIWHALPAYASKAAVSGSHLLLLLLIRKLIFPESVHAFFAI